MIEKIIDRAFEFYMPQVRSEITQLANFIQKDILDKREIDPFYQYNILEIGSKFGGTFYIWNELNNLTNGMNISIDMSDGGLHGGISDEEMDKRDLWFVERFDNCHFVRGDSHSNDTWNQLRSFTQMNPPGGVLGNLGQLYKPFLDFLFIDGDHTYEGVKKDFEMYNPFVKKGGCIAFHDIVISDRHHERNVYVGEFWKELTKLRFDHAPNITLIDGNEYQVFEFIGSTDQDWAGIGIIQLP